MSKSEKAPRFPFAAAALCAACVGAAAWTWMRYSYAWNATPKAVLLASPVPSSSPWRREYVRMHGAPLVIYSKAAPTKTYTFLREVERHENGVQQYSVLVAMPEGNAGTRGRRPLRIDTRWHLTGRIRLETVQDKDKLFLDTTASRFTWQSIAGLVVGAAGVFVFAVTLRQWLNKRRAFREAEQGDG